MIVLQVVLHTIDCYFVDALSPKKNHHNWFIYVQHIIWNVKKYMTIRIFIEKKLYFYMYSVSMTDNIGHDYVCVCVGVSNK